MTDWKDISQWRENNRLEAKKAQGGLPESIWETYSAFANTEGGLILLGVGENDADRGFYPVRLADPAQLLEEFWERVNDPAVVSENILSADDARLVTAEGMPVVAIRVPKATDAQRPVYIGTDPLTGSYWRSGDGDFRLAPDIVRGMLARRKEGPGR